MPETNERSLLVELKDVHKFYGSVHALRGVDLKVYKGEVIGLVGDNGAGKSTLIKVLGGISSLDEGEIIWEGNRVKISSPKDARKLGIEIVFQERTLIDYFTASQNIFLGREECKNFGIVKIIDYNRMNEIAADVLRGIGLKVLPTQEARFCSGGEQQGIEVARAVHFKAKLVILDEPTRGLSVAAVESVLNFVKALKNEGIACIFVTHNLNHVHPVADRIVMLSRGVKILDTKKENVSIKDIEKIIKESSAKLGGVSG